MMAVKNLVLMCFFTVLIILFFLGSTVLISFAQNSQLNRVYSNIPCGMAISYPDSWIVEERNYKLDNITHIAEIKPNTNYGFKGIVYLEAQNIFTFQNKSIEAIASLMESHHLSEIGNSVIESSKIDIQRVPSHEIIYKHINLNSDISKTKEVYIPYGNTLYILRYHTLDTDYYDNYISIVNEMIQSIRVDGRAC